MGARDVLPDPAARGAAAGAASPARAGGGRSRTTDLLKQQVAVPGVTRAYNAFLTSYLLVLDGVALVASFAVAALCYQLTPEAWIAKAPWLGPTASLADVPVGSWLRTLLIVGPVLFLPMFALFSLYQRDHSIMNVDEARRLLRAVILGSLIFFALLVFMDPVPFPRAVLAYAPIAMVVLVSGERMAFYAIQQRFRRQGIGMNRVLVYGAGETGRRLARKLVKSPGLGFAPVGYIDDDPAKVGSVVSTSGDGGTSFRVLGTFEDFPRIARAHRIQHVFVAVPSLPPERSLAVLQACGEAGVGFSVIPSLYNLMIQQVSLNDLGGIPLMTLQGPRYRVFAGFYKRAFDILFSLAVLVVLAPLFLLIAVLVKLDSPGPAFFAHTRVGKDGEEFLIYKFRSMYRDVPPHGITPASTTDPRITRLGAFLRRFSLDELPQFFNVLKGDMSTVGPRPEMPFLVHLYSEYELQRLNVKPGVTGLWQISEDRAGEIHANMDYDIYYIENQSILLDLIIVVATVFFAARGTGAH